MPIDVNRGTSGVVLPKEISSEIWSNLTAQSAVQQLARKVELPGVGQTIPVLTSDPEAGWVSETDHKPVSKPAFSSKEITPYTLAVIVPFSNQFRRDLNALYAECVSRLPGALAKKFDQTVFASTGAPGANFGQLGGATAVALGPHATNVKQNTYAGLVQAVTTVAGNGGRLNGWALSSAAEGLLLGQVDTTGRPLILDSIQDGSAVPRILGRPVAYSESASISGTPNTIGFAGDWSSAIWGSVEGVSISFSEGTIEVGSVAVADGEDTVEVPITQSLWGRNMFAVRAEIEIGFQVRDVNRFVKLTDATRTA